MMLRGESLQMFKCGCNQIRATARCPVLGEGIVYINLLTKWAYNPLFADKLV